MLRESPLRRIASVTASPSFLDSKFKWLNTDLEFGCAPRINRRIVKLCDKYADLVRRDPKNPTAQNNLAWILSRQGQAAEALDHARAAVALAPQSVDFLDTLGGILLRSGNPAQAIDPLDKAWRKGSDRPDIGFHLSQALGDAGSRGQEERGARTVAPAAGRP
jgi:predicted Zn-dependent protease